MLRIRPFPAIRPLPHFAARVASLPYDVLNRAEAAALAADNPLSFLHVVRSEIDLPESVSPYDQSVYRTARENLDRMIDQEILIQDAAPDFYLYRQVWKHRTQVGLVCCCHVQDYQDGIIKRHEKTRPEKENDRTQHVLAVNANTGPVFLAYRDDPQIARLIQREMTDRPLYHFNASDGVTHTVWQAADARSLAAAFERLSSAYVADGHHRAASAARAGAERAAANPAHGGSEEYNWFLAALFPANDLTVLPYNRVVADLNGLTPADVLQALSEVGRLESTGRSTPESPGRFCIYLEGCWHECILDSRSIDRTHPIGSLDVELLQTRILGPILGVGDPRLDARIDFVGGIRGIEELRRRVDSGDAAIAFSLFPTSMDQLLAVSDAGLVMPPKSTWFEPKLRSGLFVHRLD